MARDGGYNPGADSGRVAAATGCRLV